MRKIWTRSPSLGQSPSSKGHPGVEEQTSPTAPRTPLLIMWRTGMRESTSCLAKVPTQLVLQGQGPTVDPSGRSRYRMSREGARKRTEITPS